MAGGGRVCIIGAGAAGLTAIKACLEEGLQPVCYERYEDTGGLWNYSPEVKPGQGASVYEDLITNVSKEMMCFSDYPMPEDFTPYIKHDQYMSYLRDYVKAFDLLKHVHLNTDVLKVEKADDYSESGRWKVTVSTKGRNIKEEFDYVMVATGFFRNPKTPHIEGIETFPGTVYHSHAFRSTDALKGKRVMIIGNSISAGDIAGHVSNVAAKVYISVGSGAWILPKTTSVPFDFLLRRAVVCLPLWLAGKVVNKRINDYLDHKNIGIAPNKPVLNSYQIMLTDDLKSRLFCGAVVVKDRVVRVEGSTVHCCDGTEEKNVDVIIFATGFSQTFPFMQKGILPGPYKNMSLYRLVWPTELSHPTLAVIGYFSVAGAAPPAAELQARWAAGVFSGRIILPPRDVMHQEVRTRKEKIFQRLGCYKLKVDTLYNDELAQEAGCRPALLRTLLTDPKVGLRLLFGPLFPAQWRLQGPHSWTHARHYFLTAESRTMLSMQTRKPPDVPRTGWTTYFILTMPLLAGLFYLVI